MGFTPTRSHLLIVEDDPDCRDTLAEILAADGFPVDCASNGREALTHLQTDPLPALILTDLMMPLMDGWALLNELARDPRLSAIPVVVLSAVGDSPQAKSLSGAVSVLPKPANFEKLLGLVARYCPRGRG